MQNQKNDKKDARSENLLFKRLNLKSVLVLAVLLVIVNIVIIFAIYEFSIISHQKIIKSQFEQSDIEDIETGTRQLNENRLENSYSKIPLRIAIAPIISPEKSLILYKDFVDYLGNAVGRKGIFIIRPTYIEINKLLWSDKCDIAFICTSAYIRGKKDFGLKILAIPVIKGKITYRSYIIVPSSSKAKSLLDLKGKRFASCDILSTTGWLYPAIWLYRHNIEPERFFSEHIITRSHDRSVYSVARQYVDGAAVDHIVYEQLPRDVLAKTKVILKSPPFGMPPFVTNPKIDPVIKNKILKVLLNMHKDPDGEKILSKLGFDRFIVPKDKFYESIENMMEEWESR